MVLGVTTDHSSPAAKTPMIDNKKTAIMLENHERK